MTDKLTALDFGKKNEMLAEIEQLKRQLPALKEHTVILAELRKASYDAYIDEGFTPEQALKLCTSMGA